MTDDEFEKWRNANDYGMASSCLNCDHANHNNTLWVRVCNYTDRHINLNSHCSKWVKYGE